MLREETAGDAARYIEERVRVKRKISLALYTIIIYTAFSAT